MKGWFWILACLAAYFIPIFAVVFGFGIINSVTDFRVSRWIGAVRIIGSLLGFISCWLTYNQLSKKNEAENRENYEQKPNQKSGWKGNFIQINLSDDQKRISAENSRLSNNSSFIISIQLDNFQYIKYYNDEILIEDSRLSNAKNEIILSFTIQGKIGDDGSVEADIQVHNLKTNSTHHFKDHLENTSW